MNYNTKYLFLYKVKAGKSSKDYDFYYTYACNNEIAELKVCIHLSGGGWIQTYAEARRVMNSPEKIHKHKNFVEDFDNLLKTHQESYFRLEKYKKLKINTDTSGTEQVYDHTSEW